MKDKQIVFQCEHVDLYCLNTLPLVNQTFMM